MLTVPMCFQVELCISQGLQQCFLLAAKSSEESALRPALLTIPKKE